MMDFFGRECLSSIEHGYHCARGIELFVGWRRSLLLCLLEHGNGVVFKKKRTEKEKWMGRLIEAHSCF